MKGSRQGRGLLAFYLARDLFFYERWNLFLAAKIPCLDFYSHTFDQAVFSVVFPSNFFNFSLRKRQYLFIFLPIADNMNSLYTLSADR